MSISQKTLKKEISCEGVGLHSGCCVRMMVKPAPVDSGIVFIRVDLSDQPRIKAGLDTIGLHEENTLTRCTTIGREPNIIHTVEHFMSVLWCMGVTNCIIEVNAQELPGLDGSAAGFLKLIQDAGVVEQGVEAEVYAIQEPVGVGYDGSSIYVIPADDFRISYTLDYDHPFLGTQFFSQSVDGEYFQKEIAPCRTFCLESEAKALQAQGLGQGADTSNTLVIGEQGVIDNATRFDDEFVRHKVLDFIGDMYLFGFPIRGHVFAVRSGHALNMALLKKIYKQKMCFQKKSSLSFYDIGDKRDIRIDEIMKILPHRYPFLLVDRVSEIEKGKRGIGLKNVTANESFFQGHFPTRPVMPGVLMVEAMAQTAGVLISTNELHRDKLALFMAADNVKFRKLVAPGDQLIMEVYVLRDRPRTALVRGIAKVGNDVVVEADMLFSFTDKTFLD